MKRGIYGTGVLVCVGMLLFLCAGVAVFKRSETDAIGGSKVADEPLLSEIIERERAKWGIPKGIIEGIIWVESKFDERSFNPESKSKCYRRAKTKEEKQRCGSRGLMGIVPYWHGGDSDLLERHVERGVSILGKHYKKKQNVFEAVAAFNGTGMAAKSYAQRVLRVSRHFGYQG